MRILWHCAGRDVRFFEGSWKPNCWKQTPHFIVIRTRQPTQHNGLWQRNLFALCEYGDPVDPCQRHALGAQAPGASHRARRAAFDLRGAEVADPDR